MNALAKIFINYGGWGLLLIVVLYIIINSDTTNFLEANTTNTEATNGADRVTVTGNVLSNNGLPDGVNMFDIGEETLNQAALKKIKTKTVRDEHGNITIEKQFDEIELESKIPAIKCLADMLGWNKADQTEEKAQDTLAAFIDDIRQRNSERKPTPQTG